MTNSVTPVAETAVISRTLSATETSQSLEFMVGLRMRNFDELQARVARGEAQRVPGELVAKYAPFEGDYQAIANWLRAHGFNVRDIESPKLGVFAHGTVAQLESAFGVHFARVAFNGDMIISAVDAPVLPKTFEPLVIGIIGLQPQFLFHPCAPPQPNPDIIAHKPTYQPPPLDPAVVAAYEASRQQAAGQVPPVPPKAPLVVAGGGIQPNSLEDHNPPYIVAEIATAYNVTDLPGDGTGQQIAIIASAKPEDNDLIQFWNNQNIQQTISNISYWPNNPPALRDGDKEPVLDIEWASGMAPGAKVRVYLCGYFYPQSNRFNTNIAVGFQQLLQELQNNSNQPPIHQVSVSYAEDEAVAGQGLRATLENYFASAAFLGVTIFSGSGDGGSRPDYNSGDSYVGTAALQPEYPASSTYVTGVGGTYLTLNSDGSVNDEVAWSLNGTPYGSGGGISTYFNRPGWQVGTGVPAGNKRCVPDVALAASSNAPGYIVYRGVPDRAGGTSWASPTFAAFCARINQARATFGAGALGQQFNAKIYSLVGTTAFRDITSGTNGVDGNYNAGLGYDLVTGLGTPNVAILHHSTLLPFFKNEARQVDGTYFLNLPNGNLFGKYTLALLPTLYHYDMGYLYIFGQTDPNDPTGLYLYDFSSQHYYYTSANFPFPYLYDFTLNTTIYYYPDSNSPGHYTTNPRYFYNFATGQIFTM